MNRRTWFLTRNWSRYESWLLTRRLGRTWLLTRFVSSASRPLLTLSSSVGVGTSYLRHEPGQQPGSARGRTWSSFREQLLVVDQVHIFSLVGVERDVAGQLDQLRLIPR